jgi:ubiquinone/menaquinone biosynthesis C-methylase UbiE
MMDIYKMLDEKIWPPSNLPKIYINGFEHWYSVENIKRIDSILKNLHPEINKRNCLDIGFGNPILLERETKIFANVKALYISKERALKCEVSDLVIIEGNCYQIPFDNNSFDVISAYAFLHIIPDIPNFYTEAYRVLNNGGILYTDGDRNIYLIKLIRLFRIVQYTLTRNKTKLKYWHSIFEDNNLFHKEGIDYKKLPKILFEIGFKKVIIKSWFSTKPEYKNKILFKLAIKCLTLFRLNILNTHISIIASK